MAAGSGGGGGSGQHQNHVRGTPYHVRPSLLRLALVVAAVFLAFPALSTPLFRGIKGAERLPPELLLALLLGGAGAWAVAAFTASTAWLTLGLGGALAATVAYLGGEGLIPSSLTPLGAAAPLLIATALSHPALAPFDPLLVVGLLAGAGSRGLLQLQGSALPAEVTVLVAAVAVTVLASPGLIGHPLSQALSPLGNTTLQALAALLSLGLALSNPSCPSAMTAALTLALLVARVLSRPPEPTEAAQRHNARAAHWLLAGLLATLAAVTARGMDSDKGAASSYAGVAVVGLLLLGAGVSVLVTALLAATARVWGPVRSGEFQMVTLDFLALCAYFIAPLLFVYYLAAQQAKDILPSAFLPAVLTTQADKVKELLSPFLPSHPLAQLACLALLVVAAEEALEESSIIWAHWLIRTYTLGSLDTKRVALVARLDALLSQLSDDPESSLPRLIEESGIAHLNIFVSPSLAAEASGVCRALAKAGHTLGLETAAGPFALPFTAMQHVTQGHQRLQSLLLDDAATEGGYAQGLSWYTGQDGHRNPWALWRASRLNLHFVAPAHRVVLGDNAGRALRAALDGWYKGGIVRVDVGEGRGVDLRATLKDLAGQAGDGGYSLVGLASVCPEVQRMVLHTEEE